MNKYLRVKKLIKYRTFSKKNLAKYLPVSNILRDTLKKVLYNSRKKPSGNALFSANARDIYSAHADWLTTGQVVGKETVTYQSVLLLC
jgi:hypothetical protein